MLKKRKKDRLIYGIIGLGRFGHALARELAEADADLIVLDGKEEKIREIREITENAYIIKNLDKQTLMETGIQHADVVIVCIGEAMDVSILTTLHLVSMNIPRVIAKAASTEHGLILEKLGAEVVYPERDMAVRLAGRLETERVLDMVQLSEQIHVSKILLPRKMEGLSVKEMGLRSAYDLNIIAIETQGSVMEVIYPDYIFKKNDILFLSGSKEGMERFHEWMEA